MADPLSAVIAPKEVDSDASRSEPDSASVTSSCNDPTGSLFQLAGLGASAADARLALGGSRRIPGLPGVWYSADSAPRARPSTHYVCAHCGQGTILMSRLGSTRGTEARCGKSPRAWRKRRRCMRGYPPGLLGRASLPSQPRPPRPIHSTPVRQAESARKTPHGRKPAGGNLAGGSGLKPRRHRARAPPASRRSRAAPKPSRSNPRARARARARRYTNKMLRRRPQRLSQRWSRQQGILRACARSCATRSMRSIDGRLLR